MESGAERRIRRTIGMTRMIWVVAIAFAALFGVIMGGGAILIGCETSSARITNRSGAAVLATLKLNNDLLFWRGKIEAGQTIEPVYRTGREGQIILAVEFPDKTVKAVGSFIFWGADDLDVFVIEPEQTVTAKQPGRNLFEGLDWFCACAVQSVRDLIGTRDPHRGTQIKDKQ